MLRVELLVLLETSFTSPTRGELSSVGKSKKKDAKDS
jgi:hypothetical protein